MNATQGLLLGCLLEGPQTGWDLLRTIESGLSRFWNVTPSHVYRELRALEERGLVTAGEPGARERRPFTITPAGRFAFGAWLAEDPGPEQIRFPLLVKLWFGRHLDPSVLAGFLERDRMDHERRLALYRSITDTDPHTRAVLAFGIAYEEAVTAWLTETGQQMAAIEP